LGQQWAGGAGGGKDSSLFLFSLENGDGGDGRQVFLPLLLVVFLFSADRKTKRNGRQKEQEIDHEEIVEEEAGKKGRDRRTRNGIKQGERGVSSHGGIE